MVSAARTKTWSKYLRNKIKREGIKHLPKWILRDKHLRPHYSQFGEDIVIAGLFDRHYRGFYVDVGAHHPRFLSNTYLLWLRNWQGINIDADPLAIDAFRRERPTDINVCCAVGKSRGSAKFYKFKNPAFNTLSEKFGPQGERIATVEVPIMPLNDILFEHGLGQIDYLNVDVEGLDYDVLTAFDFCRFSPRIISIEMTNADFDQIAREPIYEMLREKGYALIAYCYVTAIFRREQPARRS